MSSYKRFEDKKTERCFATVFTDQDYFRSMQQHIDVEQALGFNIIFKTADCT